MAYDGSRQMDDMKCEKCESSKAEEIEGGVLCYRCAILTHPHMFTESEAS